MGTSTFRSIPATRGRAGARGMVRERITIVRRCFEAWAADCLQSVAHHLDPAVEVDWRESLAPYRGIYSGHSGWLALFDEIRAPFEEVRSDLHGFAVAGQHVAVPNSARMRGRDGVEVLAKSTLVFTFVGVRIVALRLFQREADALAAIRC